MRVKRTFGCAMGAATLGTDGRVKLTFLGVWLTLGYPGGLEGLSVGGRQRLRIGAIVGSVVGALARD